MNLLKATLLAIFVAAIVLVTVVLPAEYDLDPLGTGALLGLTGLSRTGPTALVDQIGSFRQERRVFELAPFESVEYKYRLESNAGLLFSWRATSEVVYDMHAEPDGAEGGYAESFAQGRGQAGHGSYAAPFPGIHGWFWENRGAETVIVTLNTAAFTDFAKEYRDNDVYELKPPLASDPQ
jgi:hypothetical protein